MRVSLIVAVAKGGVIGRGLTIPWRLPADLAFFKRTTMGHHIVMGRRTWESLGRPLPGRTHIVLSRDPLYRAEHALGGARVVGSLEEAVTLARRAGEDELFIIGGSAVYEAGLEFADRILLTRVDAEVEGDVFFPALDEGAWVETDRRAHVPDEKNEHPYAFTVLERP